MALTKREKDTLDLIHRYITKLGFQNSEALTLDIMVNHRAEKVREIQSLTASLVEVLDEWDEIQEEKNQE